MVPGIDIPDRALRLLVGADPLNRIDDLVVPVRKVARDIPRRPDAGYRLGFSDGFVETFECGEESLVGLVDFLLQLADRGQLHSLIESGYCFRVDATRERV